MKTRQAFADLYCSQESTQDLDKQIISLSVINTLLAISAIVANDVILIALRKKNNNTSSFKSVDAESGGECSRCGLYRTSFCCLLGVHSARKVANVSLLLSCLYHRSLYFDIRVIMDVGCHKRGQTFGSVFGTQVQTGCNPKTSLHSRNCTLGFTRYGQRHSCNVESYCDGNSFSDRLNNVLDNSFSLLHQKFLQVASLTNPSSQQSSRATESNNTSEFITI